MTGRQWREDAVRRMADAQLHDPHTDADLMLSDALHVSRGALRAVLDALLSTDALETLDGWLRARLTGKPLQYCQNAAWFYGRRFFVNGDVLIPRQDTEILCEEALKRIRPGARVLDLCTGSGAIAITIALEAKCCVSATDISPAALSVAKYNADALGAKVRFCEGDLFSAVEGEVFDLITCNPPYLSQRDMEQLQKEVSFEPPLALYGRDDGLSFYRRLARDADRYLAEGGVLLCEIGCAQGEAVKALFSDRARAEILRDYAGLDRVAVIHWQREEQDIG